MKFCVLPALLLLASCISSAEMESTPVNPTAVSSPSGHLTLSFQLNHQGAPSYVVHYKDSLVVDTAYFGFSLPNAPSLQYNFQMVESASRQVTYEDRGSEKNKPFHPYNELTVNLQESLDTTRALTITFKVYERGIGFTYELPDQEGADSIPVQTNRSRATGDFTSSVLQARYR